ncbi:hypothetical protein BCR43DRAFT_560981 [Syncephalastrum racemosum]|uniref:HMG box domain-containing protein n=1 Tax=Syncephalastrum racemosum TaxID=13706 RepID=A0A1X2HME4_SYNRA|nr:hypothetical protein BCR43DRAFT_560981 [Syncephalastrum racemosum]
MAENNPPPTHTNHTTEVADLAPEKYKLLKRRIREIEEDNDVIHGKLAKARKQIKRLRVERLVLLEELDGPSSRRGKRHTHVGDSDMSDAEESIMSEATSNAVTKKSRKVKHSQQQQQQQQQQETAAQRRKRDPNAPKGPGNVFFLYCRMERDKIKDEVPNESLGEVTRLLGQKWKALSKEEKQKYYDMYRKEMNEYEEAMKSYTASSSAAPTPGTPTSAAVAASAEEVEAVNDDASKVDAEEIDMLQDEDDDEEEDMEIKHDEDLPISETPSAQPSPSPMSTTVDTTGTATATTDTANTAGDMATSVIPPASPAATAPQPSIEQQPSQPPSSSPPPPPPLSQTSTDIDPQDAS